MRISTENVTTTIPTRRPSDEHINLGLNRLRIAEKARDLTLSYTLTQIQSLVPNCPSPATLCRWIKALPDEGTNNALVLVDKRHKNGRKSKDFPIKIIALAQGLWAANSERKSCRSPRKVQQALVMFKNDIKSELGAEFPNHDFDWIPSVKKLRFTMREFKSELTTSSQARFDQFFLGEGVKRKVNEVWQMDSTLLRMGKSITGKSMNVWLTSVVDVGSRMFLSCIVHECATNTAITMHALKKAMMPSKKHDFVKVCKYLQTDNASCFVNAEVQTAMAKLGTKCIQIAPNMSAQNGIIERHQQTIKNNFCSGFDTETLIDEETGELIEKKNPPHASVQNLVALLKSSRVLNPKRPAPLETVKIVLLQRAMEYNQRRHDGLPKRQCPLVWYDLGPQEVLATPSMEEIQNAFVLPEKRKVQRGRGVEINGKFWMSDQVPTRTELTVDYPCDFAKDSTPPRSLKAKTSDGKEVVLVPSNRASLRGITKKLRSARLPVGMAATHAHAEKMKKAASVDKEKKGKRTKTSQQPGVVPVMAKSEEEL